MALLLELKCVLLVECNCPSVLVFSGSCGDFGCPGCIHQMVCMQHLLHTGEPVIVLLLKKIQVQKKRENKLPAGDMNNCMIIETVQHAIFQQNRINQGQSKQINMFKKRKKNLSEIHSL